jgi:hypothetical protein
MREAGPRLFNVHMKDLADFKNKESQVAVEEGLMPVREMYSRSRKPWYALRATARPGQKRWSP